MPTEWTLSFTLVTYPLKNKFSRVFGMVFIFHFENFEEFCKTLAKLVEFTLEKKGQNFPNFLCRKIENKTLYRI
jgi:hypothetical protein